MLTRALQRILFQERTARIISRRIQHIFAPPLPPQIVTMKTVGYAVDAAILLGVGYVIRQSATYALLSQGLQPTLQALYALPTPLNDTAPTPFADAVGIGRTWLLETPRAARTAEEWYNYLLGDDLGAYTQASAVAAFPRVDVAMLREFRDLNVWKNSLLIPPAIMRALPHTLNIWLRNYIAVNLLYFIVGTAWSVYIYWIAGKRLFKSTADMPSWDDMTTQMRVSASAMVWYSLMPVFGEWLIERGWTCTYMHMSSVGGAAQWLLWSAAYLTFVEWGIYWVHRGLHHPLVYAWHKPHHIYNNRNALSPFAGLAFDPLDGMAQASPYLLGLFILPVHFWTHEVLLFFTGVWTANIHDALTGDTEPVMGSAYHTIHHTTYRNNYGQIFVLFDYLHDTLAPPQHRRAQWGWDTPTGRSSRADARGGDGARAKHSSKDE